MTKQLEQGCNDLAVNMDESLAQRLMMFSEQLGIPLWLIIQNLLLADWARRCASFEVQGAQPYRILPEFSKEVLDDGTEQVITGEPLFNMLVKTYKWELEQPLREQRLIVEQRELNNYLLLGEQSANIETLRRRRDKVEFLKNHPGKEAAWDRAEARQAEYRDRRKQQ